MPTIVANIQNAPEVKKRGRKAKPETTPVVNTNVKPQEVKTYELVIPDVIPTYRNGKVVKYSTSLSAYELGSYFNEENVVYNGEIQRGYRNTPSGNVIDIYKNSKVKEILESMIEGNLHGSVITLNLPKDGVNSLLYDSEKHQLVIKGQMEIIDGQHRIRACAKWARGFDKGKPEATIANPSDFEFPVTIEHLSNLDAGACFSEYATKPLVISKTRAEYFDVKSLSNLVARNIINSSMLKNKVDIVNTIPKGTKIMSYNYIVQGIKQNIAPNIPEQVEPISKTLIEVFDNLTLLFPEQFGEISVDQKNDNNRKWLTTAPMFVNAYIAVASELFKTKADNKKVNKVFSKLKNTITIGDWSGTILQRDCPIWEKTILNNGRLVNTRGTQKTVKDILFEYLINDQIPQDL